jgi:hypothetical protein
MACRWWRAAGPGMCCQNPERRRGRKRRARRPAAASLNLLGTAVGFSYEADGTTVDGYVRFADGILILANAPVSGQQSTVAWSINDLNEKFTGFWYDAQGAEHGFVALAAPGD